MTRTCGFFPSFFGDPSFSIQSSSCHGNVGLRGESGLDRNQSMILLVDFSSTSLYIDLFKGNTGNTEIRAPNEEICNPNLHLGLETTLCNTPNHWNLN